MKKKIAALETMKKVESGKERKWNYASARSHIIFSFLFFVRKFVKDYSKRLKRLEHGYLLVAQTQVHFILISILRSYYDSHVIIIIIIFN